jgi:glycosyltransferase involved in cell wall biosynthesis
MAGDYVRKTLKLRTPVTVNRNPITLWNNPIAWNSKSLDHILYVGRIEYRKGIQVLLQALDKLGEDAANLSVRIVGHRYPPTRILDQECIENFNACLANQGSKPYHLEYAGPCVHSDMPKHYDWAGIQIMPSLIENYPYAALEGLSRGCFLIGSAVGGIPEIIDRPQRGMLFETENSTQLAEKIRECRQRQLEISQGMPAIVESIRTEFDPEACYQRLMEVYDTNLAKKAIK